MPCGHAWRSLEAVQERRELAGRHPDNATYNGQLGEELHNLARLYASRGSQSQATALLEEAIEWQKRAQNAEPSQRRFKKQLRNHQTFLAFCMALDAGPQQDLSQAEHYARQSLELDPQDAASWQSLGMVQHRNGQWQAAVDSLTKANELSDDDDLPAGSGTEAPGLRTQQGPFGVRGGFVRLLIRAGQETDA